MSNVVKPSSLETVMATVNERRHGSRTRTGVRRPVPDSISSYKVLPREDRRYRQGGLAFEASAAESGSGTRFSGPSSLAYLISLVVRNADQRGRGSTDGS